jgi:hypothetical protein
MEEYKFEDDFTIAGEDKDRDFCTITETTDRVLANKSLI